MDVREAIVWAVNELLRRKLTVYTAGNVSARAGEHDGFYITPSGLPYPDTRREDIVLLDWDGGLLAGERPPSIERDLHRLIYLARPDVSAIVHTHSQFATTLAASRLRCGIPPVLGEVWGYLGGPIELAEYGPAGSLALAENVVRCLGQQRRAALLKNHGALAVGQSLSQAVDFAEIVEKCAESFVLVQMLGGYDDQPETYAR